MLRVATYNLYLGADVTRVFGVRTPEELAAQTTLVHEQLVATNFPARAAAIATILARERVDVVGLQEVARWTRTPSRDGTGGAPGAEPVVWMDFLGELLGALDRTGQAYDAHAVTANFHGGARLAGADLVSVLGHNAVLVRRGSGVEVTGTSTGDFTPVLEVATAGSDLVLHVARSWGWVDARFEGRAFRFVNTHTEAWDEEVRNAQRDELLSALGVPEHPVIVVGDFNAVPELVGMPTEYVDAWAAAGTGGPGPTCGQAPDLANDESLLHERIDYVWVRGAEVVACRVVGNRPSDRTPSAGLWPSDHAAVVADVRL